MRLEGLGCNKFIQGVIIGLGVKCVVSNYFVFCGIIFCVEINYSKCYWFYIFPFFNFDFIQFSL
jgi:hypothetical protein